jgi:predicted transcriptional regulator of viral defense system
MNYFNFRKQFFELGCFSVHQVYAWQSSFEKTNLTRWVKQGQIIKLKNGYYTFPEYLKQPEFAYYISNKIYCPSYISLHSTLAFYDMIPEAITQITAVSSLKTANFENSLGTFSYKKVAPKLFFGYEHKAFDKNRTFLFATPEKALLDLLYLYPFYNTAQEIAELRLDNDFLHHNFNTKLFNEFLEKFENQTLNKRAKLLFKVYDL